MITGMNVAGRKIYLAIPYAGMERRSSRIADAITIRLLRRGAHVFSPITYGHAMTRRHSLPGSWEFWKGLDTEFLEWADELWVVTLEGWKTSVGVSYEVEKARQLGKPVRYLCGGRKHRI